MTIRAFIVVTIVFASATIARAAEVHSNGTGGGLWSDPATLRTKAPPGAEDSAVISAGDTVTFDGGEDRAKTSCKDLYIDAGGAMSFKPGGKRVLALAGPLESYGVIKLDAAGAADESIEICFIGKAAQRNLKLVKGGALIATGRADLADGRRNVILRSNPTTAPTTPPELDTQCYIDAGTGTSIDLQHVQLDMVRIRASKIDSTGARPNERFNIAGCVFSMGGAVNCSECDTPSIVDNTFDYGPDINPNPASAIAVAGSPLADIRRNRITGRYAYGISGAGQTDSVVENNTIDRCSTGIFWFGANAMLKGNVVRAATIGLLVTGMSGVIEDLTLDGCTNSFQILGAWVQVSNLTLVNVPPRDSVRIYFSGGTATFVNCDVTPEQIKMADAIAPPPPAPAPPAPRVQVMEYLVAHVSGTVPPGAAVNVTTANPPKPLAKGAPDLNIRNSPAAIGSAGLTPLPQSLKSLMVKSWQIESDGKLTPAPQYTVTVTAPADKPDGEPKVLKSVTVTPDAKWLRAKIDDPTPTMEITLP